MNPLLITRLSAAISAAVCIFFSAGGSGAEVEIADSVSIPRPVEELQAAANDGTFRVAPELVLRRVYDSNIYALPDDAIADRTTTATATVTGRSAWRQHQLNLDLGAETSRYDAYSSEDVTDYWAGFDGRYDLSPTGNVFGGFRFSRNHEDRDSPASLANQSPTAYYASKAFLGGAYQSGRISARLGATGEFLDYLNAGAVPAGILDNDDRDQLLSALGIRVTYLASPGFAPFLQATTDARHYKRNADTFGYQRSSDGYRASVGATFKLDEQWRAEAFLGTLYQRYDDPRFAAVHKPYFGASLDWNPVAGTSLGVTLDRALAETTVLGASGYLDTSVALSAERAVTRDLELSARLAYSIADYQGVSRQDKVTGAHAGLKYYIYPTVFLAADLGVTNRDSNQPSTDYARTQLMFSLGYAPGRKRPAVAGLESLGEAGANASLQFEVMPRLGYFEQTTSSAYLNRYQRLGNGAAVDDGFVGDADFSLRYRNGDDGFVFLDKSGLGINNQQLHLQGGNRSTGLRTYYTRYVSAPGAYGFQYNPDQMVGGTDPRYADPAFNSTGESKHVAYFHNDSPGERDYELKRTAYGASLLLKPAAFGNRASLEFGYDGYQRQGKQVFNYIFDNHALSNAGGTAEQNQWRGFANTIDERDGKLSYHFNFTPENWFVNYEFSIDKYQNDAPPVTFSTVSQWASPNLVFAPGVDSNTPLGFVPDSTLFRNALRVSRTFSDTAVFGAGISLSRLEQNTFSSPQLVLGFTNGQTDTHSAYLTGKFNISQAIGLEAFARYSGRENKSSYPVADFYEPVSVFRDPRMVAPRIDHYNTLSYGLEATLYRSFLKTRWSAGWTHERKTLDLTYGVVPALVPPVMLYGEAYRSNEVFLKLVSRPARGWVVRLTPSCLWADETGLVTNPNRMLKVKSSAMFTRPELSGLAVTGYFNYTRRMNNSLGYSDYRLSPEGFTDRQNQDVTNTMRSAGVNFNVTPAEDLKLSLGYDWNQNDLRADYFTTNRLRFDFLPAAAGSANPNPTIPLDFLDLGRFNYKVNTHTLTAGVEKLWRRYQFNANYSLVLSKGHNAAGLAGESLPAAVDRVDSRLHALALSMAYSVKKNLVLRGDFLHERYEDKAYESTGGRRNTFWIGLNYRFQ